jgi:hypothetical protein
VTAVFYQELDSEFFYIKEKLICVYAARLYKNQVDDHIIYPQTCAVAFVPRLCLWSTTVVYVVVVVVVVVVVGTTTLQPLSSSPIEPFFVDGCWH